MMTKLVIVEGLPASGKSTAARTIAKRLEMSGRKIFFVDEGTGDHPADYEFHAYVSDNQLSKMPKEDRETVKAVSVSRRGGFIVPLAAVDAGLREKLMPYKIYDGLPWEIEKPLMLEKWREFADHAENEDAVYVFNCVLLQNPMCETMMRFDLPLERSFEYIKSITERIVSLEPIVFYMKTDRIEGRILSVAKERGDWLDQVIDYHANGGYGKRIGAKGLDGYIRCLRERQKRELAVLQSLPIRSFVIENAAQDFGAAHEKMAEILDLNG